MVWFEQKRAFLLFSQIGGSAADGRGELGQQDAGAPAAPRDHDGAARGPCEREVAPDHPEQEGGPLPLAAAGQGLGLQPDAQPALAPAETLQLLLQLQDAPDTQLPR